MCETKLEQAVENNVAWCQLVSTAFGKPSFTTDKVWGLHTTAPQYYPELITTSRTTIEEDIQEFMKLDHIDSVKDSYAKLQLEPFGFELLIEAEWIYHPSVNEQKPESYQWRIVQTKKEFEQWTKTTGLENSIPVDILGNEGVKIFYRDSPTGFASFIANVAADAVGISNVFSSGMDNVELWRAIPQVVSTEYPGLPLVGYEEGDSLSDTRSSGWTSIGALRVWIISR